MTHAGLLCSTVSHSTQGNTAEAKCTRTQSRGKCTQSISEKGRHRRKGLWLGQRAHWPKPCSYKISVCCVDKVNTAPGSKQLCQESGGAISAKHAIMKHWATQWMNNAVWRTHYAHKILNFAWQIFGVTWIPKWPYHLLKLFFKLEQDLLVLSK